jgi:hypothetical protein
MDISAADFATVLTNCARLPDVRQEVLKNHDDNRWWPNSVEDWRLRLVIAGLSARVSYAMIGTYSSVVSALNEVGYRRVARLPDPELAEILKPLGLVSARLAYCRSLVRFVERLEAVSGFQNPTNDALIHLMVREVQGAGYHVAQCCVLYARGYYCGVIPVDSGMRDKLSLCIGLRVPRTPQGYELMRKELERLVSEIDCRSIARQTGYRSLALPRDQPLTWWTHLVLIYYKRLYCNYHREICPIRLPAGVLSYPCELHISPRRAGLPLTGSRAGCRRPKQWAF